MRASVLVLAANALFANVALAQTQQWAFDFNISLAANPTATQNEINLGLATLPALPVTEMQTIQLENDTMTLWFWPENAALLNGISDAGAPMVWPTTTVMCTQHESFMFPSTLLLPGASTACAATETSIQQLLSNLSACILVEQPEQYVLSYPTTSPSEAEKGTDSIEDMVGVAGQALSLSAPPATGVLPSNFVPMLRSILDKIRDTTLTTQLQTASTNYAQASTLVTSNAACFDPTTAVTLVSQIAGLTGEINTASTYLQNLMATGTAASAQENVCLATQSRVRNTLPYPALTAPERQFLAFWLGGVYWRMRGGGLIPLGSTFDARYYFVEEAFSRIGEVLGAGDGDTAAEQFFLAVFAGWSQWMTMGALGGDGGDKYYDLVGMSGRGQEEVEGAISQLSGYETDDLMAGGLQMGPGYYFGWWGQSGFTYADSMSPPYGDFMDGQTAIGEFNMGAALGLGLAKSLLNGKATNQPPTATLCVNSVCGSDGCGGSCGACATGMSCTDAGQCVVAVIAMDGGDDGDAGSEEPDAGTPPEVDAGSPPDVDGGSPPRVDAGTLPATDAGAAIAPDGGATSPDDLGPSPAGGCSCGTTGSAPFVEICLAMAGLLRARRRRRFEKLQQALNPVPR